MRILLVDDDEALMGSLAERLIHQRYAVDIAVDGSSAESYLDLFDYDLVVLDLMLPDGDGIEFCQQFRAAGYLNPLMILTAKESTMQKVKALDAGADDYVIKPFDFDELCARIRALLRRDPQGLPPVLQWGPLRLDPIACETTFETHPIHLTPKEFSMMELFLRNPHRVYSLGSIIDDLWSLEDPPGEDAVRTHIKGLRRKLQAAGVPKNVIKTVYGLGYRLNEQITWPPSSLPVASEDALPEASPEASPEGLPAVSQEMADKLAQACERYLCHASEQITYLESAVAALSEGAMDAELYRASQVHIHQLAGSLGSFGLHEGSKLARQLETHWGAFSSSFTAVSAPSSSSPASASVPVSEASANANGVLPTAFPLKATTQLVSQLREQLNRATLQAARVSLSASLKQGMPRLLLISEDAALGQALEQAADILNIQVMWAIPPSGAGSVESLFAEQVAVSSARSPDLLILDVVDDASPFTALIAQAQQDYALPVVVLEEKLSLESRLALVKQGVHRVGDRTAPPLQILESVLTVLQASAGDIKVAIVDDDPQMLDLLKASLQPWGFVIRTFESALELWQWLTDSGLTRGKTSPVNLASNLTPADLTMPAATVKVDILVLDVEMPEMGGIELCQVIRADARFQSMPVLFLTAHQEDALRLEAFQAGANDFIDKAVAPGELAVRLRNQLS